MRRRVLFLSIGCLILVVDLLISCGNNRQPEKQASSAPSLALKTDSIAQPTDSLEKINDKESFHQTFNAFKKAVKKNNIDSMRQFINFPLQTTNQWSNDDLKSREIDKTEGKINYSEFKQYYSNIFHADVRRLMPKAGDEDLEEIDRETKEDYYRTLLQLTDKGSAMYEMYMQYAEKNGTADSYFAFIFGRIHGQYKLIAYYAKWPPKI